jgi:hypothetical protein
MAISFGAVERKLWYALKADTNDAGVENAGRSMLKVIVVGGAGNVSYTH